MHLPMRCGVNGVVLRISFHLWRRKTVGQGRILQSQISRYILIICISNDIPYMRVAKRGGDHICRNRAKGESILRACARFDASL